MSLILGVARTSPEYKRRFTFHDTVGRFIQDEYMHLFETELGKRTQR